MANPQLENGNIEIANEIVEALARIQLSGYESRVLWALLRKTWGWVQKTDDGKTKRDKKGKPLKKKTAVIPSKDWTKLTGLNKHNVSRTLRGLELRQIVIKNDNTYFVIKNDNVFSKNDNGIREIDNKKIPKDLFIKKHRGSKETLKETLKESKHVKSAFQPPQNSKKLEEEVEKLITLYKKTFPEHIKVYKIGAIINMRNLVRLSISKGIPLEAIRGQIQKSKTGTPWEILNEYWMKEIIRPKTPEQIIEYQKKRLGWSPYEQIKRASKK